METIVATAKVATVVNEVGLGLIIRTLTTATSNIIILSQKLTSYDQPYTKDVVVELKKLDLECNISIMDALVEEHKEKDLPQSIQISLQSVSEILKLMHEELTQIHGMIEYHNTLWWNTWRVLDCTKNIDKMKGHKILFNERYRLLLDLLKINNK